MVRGSIQKSKVKKKNASSERMTELLFMGLEITKSAEFCRRPNNVAARILEGSFYALSLAEDYVVVRRSE